MFSVGDQIMYGSMGVCTVVDIGTPEFSVDDRVCYILEPQFVANSKVYAPVEKNPVSMRPVLTAQQAQNLIEDLPHIQPFSVCKDRQELHNTCKSALKSADSVLLAKLIKTLYERKRMAAKSKKAFPSAEKEYFDLAEKILYGEISICLDIPLNQVEEYISSQQGQPRAAAVS